jgi:hypothetical protein
MRLIVVLAFPTEKGCPRHALYGGGRFLPSAAPMSDRNVTIYHCSARVLEVIESSTASSRTKSRRVLRASV